MLMASCICTILIPIVLYGVVTAFGGRGRDPEIPDNDKDKDEDSTKSLTVQASF